MTRDRLDALEAHRLAFVAHLDALAPEVVHAAPAPSAWSLAQLAEHLVKIDRGLRLGGPEAGPIRTVRSRAGRLALQGVLSLPVRIPAPPSARGVMPSAAPSWVVVREAWAALRVDWQTKLPRAAPAAVAYEHPLVGRLRLDDALAFLLAHHRHHDAQVWRTLRSLEDVRRMGSPPSTDLCPATTPPASLAT